MSLEWHIGGYGGQVTYRYDDMRFITFGLCDCAGYIDNDVKLPDDSRFIMRAFPIVRDKSTVIINLD